jgi:hypothetical protein
MRRIASTPSVQPTARRAIYAFWSHASLQARNGTRVMPRRSLTLRRRQGLGPGRCGPARHVRDVSAETLPIRCRGQGRRSGKARQPRRGCHTSLMSRFVEDIRLAVARGDLPQRFRPEDVRRACPGWASHTYGVFLPKHRLGNPAGIPSTSCRIQMALTASSAEPATGTLVPQIERPPTSL